MVVNPIKVNSFAYHFNCTTVGLASNQMRHLPKSNLGVTRKVDDRHPFRVVLGRAYRGLTGEFLLLRNFSVANFCESSCLFHLSFNCDFCVSKMMHLFAMNLLRKPNN